MTFDATPTTIVDLNFDQLYLEIPPLATELPSHLFSTPGACRRAEINQRCLDAFLPWLREEQATIPNVWTRKEALPSFWEFVNGTAISLDTIRLVLIPTEAIDLSELRVSQEWVDIPNWAADYYLYVQVNLAEDWIRVVGYITHQRLKVIGTYEASDRTYCVNSADLIADLNLLWIARQFCPNETLRAEISPLPILPQSQAENLLKRLGNPDLIFPRLEIPFELWGSLLTHGGWRQRLYEKRQGLAEQWSIQQWLQTGISTVAQQLGWGQIEVSPMSVMPGTRGIETPMPTACLSKQLVIAGEQYELRVIPQGNISDRLWRFEVDSVSGQLIPVGFILRLLTEDLQPFENNSDTATTDTEQLYLEVLLEPGEGLVWEVEPLPDNYEQEILRF